MAGILIIAHGSRKKETEIAMAKIVDMVKQELPDYEAIDYTFLQFAKQNFEKTLLEFVNKGIDDIKVIPYFLFDGVHTKEDIPKLIKDFTKKYPNVKVTLGRNLGEDTRLAQIVVDRVKEI